jgi:hypothetical protein
MALPLSHPLFRKTIEDGFSEEGRERLHVPLDDVIVVSLSVLWRDNPARVLYAREPPCLAVGKTLSELSSDDS